uniref:Uncharacterized protein n=1 Tax=Globodera rostochiensis TaxID=31243 RepID=A0A914IAE1_GLORO
MYWNIDNQWNKSKNIYLFHLVLIGKHWKVRGACRDRMNVRAAIVGASMKKTTLDGRMYSPSNYEFRQQMGVSTSGLVAFALLIALTLPGLSWGDESASSPEELTPCEKMSAKCRDNWGECFPRDGYKGDACCDKGSSWKCSENMTDQEVISKDPAFAKLVNCLIAGHPDWESLFKCMPDPSKCKVPYVCRVERWEIEHCPRKLKCLQRKHSDIDALWKCWPNNLSEEECNAPMLPIENTAETSPAEELTPCEKMSAKCRDNWGECFARDGYKGDACCDKGSSWKCSENMTMDERISKDSAFAKMMDCYLAGHPDLESLKKCVPDPSECKSPRSCWIRGDFEVCPKLLKCVQRKHSNWDALKKCLPRSNECNDPLPPMDNTTEAVDAPLPPTESATEA